VANPLVNEPVPSAYIPFMPNMKYVQKNWAPERYSREALRALAEAQVLGEENGAFSRDHGEYFLPNQLVENRPNDFAVMGIDSFEKGKTNPFEPLGLRFGLRPTPNKRGAAKFGPEQLSYAMQPMLKGAANIEQNSLISGENAKVAALMFAIKAQQQGTDKLHSPAETVRRWNGNGTKDHLDKVEAMREMMKRPENTEIREVWQHLYNQARMRHGPREESSSLSIAR